MCLLVGWICAGWAWGDLERIDLSRLVVLEVPKCVGLSNLNHSYLQSTSWCTLNSFRVAPHSFETAPSCFQCIFWSFPKKSSTRLSHRNPPPRAPKSSSHHKTFLKRSVFCWQDCHYVVIRWHHSKEHSWSVYIYEGNQINHQHTLLLTQEQPLMNKRSPMNIVCGFLSETRDPKARQNLNSRNNSKRNL